ncbi:hypothetical protein HYX10_03005 [Candidatus Woesearchaeota archaeon]|nr:hypothetical protein [Candidatus Woesearchaeota archaeon]
MYSAIGSGYSSHVPYGSLENIVMYSAEPQPHIAGQPRLYSTCAYDSYKTVADEQPTAFLNPQRPATPLVGQSSELMEPIREAFQLTTGQQLPEGIIITIAAREELVQKHIAFLSSSVVGLSIPETQEVFAAAGNMDEVMLTIGHELGHVIRKQARTAQEEEAKAFAFEAAWAKAIFEHDIAGLRNSINAAALSPAKNGLHDTAFNFVKNNAGIEPMQLFNSISDGSITAAQVAEGMQLPFYSIRRQNRTKLYGGYLNKSRVQNFPPPHSFFWADLGRGIYGMYVPSTAITTLNEQLLRKDIEQLHKTMGHEYSLHHVMGLPDGYVAEALEEAMFWTSDDEGHSK